MLALVPGSACKTCIDLIADVRAMSGSGRAEECDGDGA